MEAEFRFWPSIGVPGLDIVIISRKMVKTNLNSLFLKILEQKQGIEIAPISWELQLQWVYSPARLRLNIKLLALQ